jgi:hypothetical protein
LRLKNEFCAPKDQGASMLATIHRRTKRRWTLSPIAYNDLAIH